MSPDLSVIFLDLDGTLIDSVGIKDMAFQELFADYPEQLPEILDYHMAHNAVVRFDKFRHIVLEILNEALSEERMRELSGRFSELVLAKIIKTANTPGSLSFLQKFSGLVPMVLISVTPEKELQNILEQRGIDHYFARVYGAKWQKNTAMKDYMGSMNVSPDNCVYIGDTPEDLEYARKVDVSFIGRDSGRVFPERPTFLFENMSDVAEQLEILFEINN